MMKKRRFGSVEGRAVDEIVLESADAAVSILSYGCTLRDWRVDGASGSVPVVLGFPSIEDYVHHAQAHGAVCGRVANRIAGAAFELDGRRYDLTPSEGPNQLHGGKVGLQRRIWQMDGDAAGEAVQLSYLSPDGEEGFPGTVAFEITIRLDGPRLVYEMHGRPDRPTPINLAQHAYYNLGGGGDVLDHVLWVDAAEYTPTGPDLIPDGSIRTVEGTHLDFRAPRSIAESDPERIGLDNNLVLPTGRDTTRPAAWVTCPRTNLRLQLWTQEPALQLFDAAHMEIPVPGHEGRSYGAYAGLCLEAQHFPDSVHQPEWPSIIRTPETPYFQRLTVEIGPE
jgi:aldose 1-epimerase